MHFPILLGWETPQKSVILARAPMKLEVVRHDTRCAVCWGTLKKVKVVSPCLHRFCQGCIEEHLRKL